MVGPVYRVGRLLHCYPGAAEIREKWDRGRVERNLAEQLSERVYDRRHHRRVEGMLCLDALASHPTRKQLLLCSCHSIGIAREDARERRIDSRKGETIAQ